MVLDRFWPTVRAAFVVASAAALLSCDAPTSDRIETATRFVMLWETGDTGTLDDLVAPGAVYRDTPNDHDYVGADIADYFDHVHSWSSGTRIKIRSQRSTPDGAVIEWHVSGVQTSAIGERLPIATGNDWGFDGITVFTFTGDRIQKATDYYDVAGFMTQMDFTFTPPARAEAMFENNGE